jgi:hypothetical protein
MFVEIFVNNDELLGRNDEYRCGIMFRSLPAFFPFGEDRRGLNPALTRLNLMAVITHRGYISIHSKPKDFLKQRKWF